MACVTASHLCLPAYLRGSQEAVVGHSIFSQEFLFNGNVFHLEVYPYGKERGTSEYLSAYLASSTHEKKGTPAPKFSVQHTLSVRCYRINELLSKINRVTHSVFTDKASSWGWHELCVLGTLKQKLKDDDTLTVTSTLFASCEQELGPAGTVTIVADAAATPPDVLLSFDDDSFFSDCVVASSDGRKFTCHRVVLGTASAVFKAAFSCNMQEAHERAISIAADACTLHLFLLHLYGAAQLEVPVPHLVPLLQLADQYELPKLQHVLNSTITGLSYSQPAAWLLCRQASHIRDIEVTTHLLGTLEKGVDWDAEEAVAVHLDTWEEADVAMLLEASDSSYIAIRIAMHWAALHMSQQQQQQQAGASPCQQPASHPGHMQQQQQEQEQDQGAQEGEAAERRPMEAGKGWLQDSPTSSSLMCKSHSLQRESGGIPGGHLRAESAAVHPAWEAAFCPLMSFKGLSSEQLRQVHGCKGAASMPRAMFNQLLVDGWNAWFDRSKGPASSEAAAGQP